MWVCMQISLHADGLTCEQAHAPIGGRSGTHGCGRVHMCWHAQREGGRSWVHACWCVQRERGRDFFVCVDLSRSAAVQMDLPSGVDGLACVGMQIDLHA